MTVRDGRARRPPPILVDLRWLTRTTVGICLRYRVTGLAAEIGFFALLSLPPLVLGLAGTLGYFADVIGANNVERIRQSILDLARHALSDQTVADTIVPTLNDVFRQGRFDIVSVGFVLALWSGSRALNVTIDTISIMYGLGGHRGIIATRALSFSLYIVALIVGIVLFPLVIGGPKLFSLALPGALGWLGNLYWPLVSILPLASLTTLFWIAIPVPNSWWRGVPGAVLALAGALGGSYGLRAIIDWSVGGSSIYGPLAAPIVVLIWLYVLAILMLIGAAFNAATDRRWPQRVDEAALDGSPTGEIRLPGRSIVRPPGAVRDGRSASTAASNPSQPHQADR